MARKDKNQIEEGVEIQQKQYVRKHDIDVKDCNIERIKR